MKLAFLLVLLYSVFFVNSRPPLPQHTFIKRVLEKKTGPDKVFVSLELQGYRFKRRRVYGDRENEKLRYILFCVLPIM
jgi:hypothetical protein